MHGQLEYSSLPLGVFTQCVVNYTGNQCMTFDFQC